MDAPTTSKSLVRAWMDPSCGNEHYSKWRAKKLKLAICKCGLAPSKYGNKTANHDILRHLSQTELPLDPGEVLRTLDRENILYAGASSKQQRAYYVLLRETTPAGNLPILYVKSEPILVVKGPGRHSLAQCAKRVLHRRTLAQRTK